MPPPPSTDVTTWLDALDATIREVVDTLRAMIRANAPDATETVLWDGLSYHRPAVGGRVKGAVCQIVVKGGEVRLDLIHGVRLPDPGRLLQGDRVSKRFIPIPSIAVARRRAIAVLVRKAAALNWSR